MKNIILFVALFFLLSCSGKQEGVTKSETLRNENSVSLTEAQMKNAGIVTGKMEQKTIASLLKVNGRIDVPPQNIVSISVPLGGYLKEANLLPGMHVSKGESIAVLEDPQYIQLQQDYLTAKAKLTFAEAEFKRQKELNQSKAVSDKIFQQAQADFIGQKVMVKSLSEKLKLININPETLSEDNLSRRVNVYSPIDGYVSRVFVNIGRYAKPEDVLFEIVNPSDIHLALSIFEKDINNIAVGQKLVAYTNSVPEKKYPCEIILIGKDFSTDWSVEVHCHFDKYDSALIPGMFMNAEIEIHAGNALALPSDAIVSFENKNYVFLSKGKNEFEMIEIKAGNSENGFTEIWPAGKMDLNDQPFAVKGAYSLLMKMKNMEEE